MGLSSLRGTPEMASVVLLVPLSSHKESGGVLSNKQTHKALCVCARFVVELVLCLRIEAKPKSQTEAQSIGVPPFGKQTT